MTGDLQIRADRAELAAAVSDAARTLPTRPASPILNGLRLTASEDGYLEVVGYDYDVCLRATIGCDVVTPGVTLVPGKPLAAFLAGMPDGQVQLQQDAARLNITMPRVRYGLNTMHAEDYPTPPSPPARSGTLPVDVLARALARVLPSARPVPAMSWSGAVNLVGDAQHLRMAATDRYTVASTAVTWDGPDEPFDVLVGGKSLSDALRGMTGDVVIGADPTGIGLTSGERGFTSRRIDGDFVDWRAFIGRLAEPTTVLRIRADELAGAMGRAQQVVAEDRVPVCLTAHPGESLTYSALADGKSELDGSLDAASVDGDPAEVGVNPQYLADALKPFGTAVAQLDFRGATKPLTITHPDRPDDVFLVMPVRLNKIGA